MSSIVRRAGTKLVSIIERALDPGALANRVQTYSKDVAGVSQLFAQTSDGVVYQLTPNIGAGREIPTEMWAQNDVPALQAGAPLSTQVSQYFDDWKVDRAGSIVGLSTRFTEAITDAAAGSAIVTVAINGAPGTLLVSHSAGLNPTGGVATQAIGIDTFVAGDLLSIQITTLGTFAPVTTDVEAYLEIDTQ